MCNIAIEICELIVLSSSRGSMMCLCVCSAERHVAVRTIKDAAMFLILNYMWFMEIIQISTSLGEGLLWWWIMSFWTRMTFSHLWYSKKQNINWRYLALMRFKSYQGSSKGFLTAFSHWVIQKEHFFRISPFFCVPQKNEDHTYFERHECEK